MTTLIGRRVSVAIDGERVRGVVTRWSEDSDWLKLHCDEGTDRLVHVEDFELDREAEIEEGNE